MKSTCIQHPAKEPSIIIRNWQIEFCDNDTTGAALLSFFEYWHNIKLEMANKNREANEIAAKNGDISNLKDVSLYQFHTEKQLEDGIKISKKTKIAKSLRMLEIKGVIKICNNPNPHYKFDKTRHFLFFPDVINNWLQNRNVNKNGHPSPKNGSRQDENGSRQDENGSRQDENGGTIPEITPDITAKITNKNKNTMSQLLQKDCFAVKLSQLLYSLMLKNDPKAKEPNYQKWAEHIDKLHRIDNRPYNEIEEVIRWTQEDNFEKSNILSTAKLRKRYPQLRLKYLKSRSPQKREIPKNLQGLAELGREWFGDGKFEPGDIL